LQMAHRAGRTQASLSPPNAPSRCAQSDHPSQA
jgi:hypothetical protein